jgi:hypothetical protein
MLVINEIIYGKTLSLLTDTSRSEICPVFFKRNTPAAGNKVIFKKIIPVIYS